MLTRIANTAVTRTRLVASKLNRSQQGRGSQILLSSRPLFSHAQSNSTPSPTPIIAPAPSPSSLIPNPIELTFPLIQHHADRSARPVSLKDMLAMGSRPEYILAAAQWLWVELPVRLAKRLRDLEDLPFGLTQSVEVQHLITLYQASLRDALSIKSPHSTAEELAFTEVIKSILTRHQQVVVDLASGVNGGFLRSRSGGLTGPGSGFASRPANQHFLLQELLDRFNAARIGLRMLMAQHVALHSPQEGMVGVIELDCDIPRIVTQAIEDATNACRLAYGYSITPEVEITDIAAKTGDGIKPFSYVPAHLRFMVFELLKNGMRATIEHARKKKAMSLGWKIDSTEPMPKFELTPEDLPPIQVVIVDGPTDITLKISDLGGGIKRSELPLLFSYTYSSIQRTQAQRAEQVLKAQRAHQQLVNEMKEGGESTATATSSDTPTPTSSSSSSPPASAFTPTPFSPTSDWLTGANFQPTLNASLHNYGEAFGLPITRLYSRHFGGDLQLYSLHGHGTDAFLFINRLGDMPEQLQD